MSEIKKNIPIPTDLEGTPVRGGHTPQYPFRDMDPGDYMEIKIEDYDQREKALTALRNARKARPKWAFVWKYGESVEEKNRIAEPLAKYIKIWRKK